MTCYLFGRDNPVHLFLLLCQLDALGSLSIFESLLEGMNLILRPFLFVPVPLGQPHQLLGSHPKFVIAMLTNTVNPSESRCREKIILPS